MAATRPTHPQRRTPLRSWRASLAGGLLTVILLIAAVVLADYKLQSRVTVRLAQESVVFRTRANTVQQALDDAGVVLDPEDVVSPPLDARLQARTTITIRKAHPVALLVAGGVRHIRTQSTHPLDILAEQGIAFGTHDRLQVDGQDLEISALMGQSWQTPPDSLRVIPSVGVTIQDGAQSYTIHTTQADVGRVLDGAGIELYAADRVIPELASSVTEGLVIRIERSVPLTVLADGQRLSTRALGPTVSDALSAIGLAPAGQDYTVPALDVELEPGMTILLVRVTEDVVTQEESIPYSTIYQSDSNLLLDEKRVIQEGHDGIRTRKIRVRYENGDEVSRVVQEEWVSRPPTPRMIALGEREIPHE